MVDSFCSQLSGMQVAFLNEYVMKTLNSKYTFFLSICVLLALHFFVPAAYSVEVQQSQRSGAELKAAFQHLLSNFFGAARSQWARIDFDPQQKEIYTLTQGINEVRIFNQQGMEIFAFGDNGDLVSAVDIASGDDGAIYILSRAFHTNGIQVLNYRGELKSIVTINDLPVKFAGFSPDQIEYLDGLFYLLDSGALQIVVIDTEGTFKKGHDLSSELSTVQEEQDLEKDKARVLEISGFSVGQDKRIYFTVPVLFSAFRLNLDESLDAFGTPGSGPGKFGVVSGIVADDQGIIYVADRLRSVVMIFDQAFVFQGEFGYRGDRPQDMIVPDDLALDQEKNRVFVSQAANKGVGVYSVKLVQSR